MILRQRVRRGRPLRASPGHGIRAPFWISLKRELEPDAGTSTPGGARSRFFGLGRSEPAAASPPQAAPLTDPSPEPKPRKGLFGRRSKRTSEIE